MDAELLSLKWNNHMSRFLHVLSSLREQEAYSDVTLACEGKFFPVHRFVLATCSDYFSEILEQTRCKSPAIIINGIEVKCLQYLLDYMYLGQVEVPQCELNDLVKAAESLQIRGLVSQDRERPPSTSKRPADSELKSQSKKLKTKKSEIPLPLNPIAESEAHVLEEYQFSDRSSLTKDWDQFDEDEPPLSPSTETLISRDTDSCGGKIDGEDRHIKKQIHPHENLSCFLADSAGLSCEEENSKNAKKLLNKGNASEVAPLPKGLVLHRCSYCGKQFKQSYDLRRHVMIHTGERPFECPVCFKAFNRDSTLKKHMTLHMRNS